MNASAIALGAAVLALSLVDPAAAQQVRTERSETMQRRAVAAWTACIASEFPEDVEQLLSLDYRSDDYRELIGDLSQRRVSQECFDAMPRAYRRIRLTGLPFAGGLAERMLEADDAEPLVNRFARAAIGREAVTYSYTDQVANCAVRGAPDLVANLFASEVASEEETSALSRLAPVIEICSQNGSAIQASPLAMRAMLATAGHRLLAAQEESDTDA